MKKIVLGRSSPSGIAFIMINVVLIGVSILMLVLGLGFLSLVGLLFLGAIQLISALLGAIRGNRIKGVYLGASIIFLVIYVGGISGYFPFSIRDKISEVLLAVGAPLMMAVIYVIILLFSTNEVAKPSLNEQEQLLDDEVF